MPRGIDVVKVSGDRAFLRGDESTQPVIALDQGHRPPRLGELGCCDETVHAGSDDDRVEGPGFVSAMPTVKRSIHASGSPQRHHDAFHLSTRCLVHLTCAIASVEFRVPLTSDSFQCFDGIGPIPPRYWSLCGAEAPIAGRYRSDA